MALLHPLQWHQIPAHGVFLKYKNIIDGEICFLRSKTARAYGGSKIIRAVITPEMMDILRRWGNPYDGNPETLLFDYAEGATDMLSISNTVRKVISILRTTP